MTDIETITERWSTIYVATGKKTHLSPNCRYVDDSYRKVDPDVMPNSHIDLCSWCENHFTSWEDGLSNAPKAKPTTEELIETGGVDESDRSKPDPSEPFRYVCPDCRREVFRKPDEQRYYCHGCNEGYTKSELWDKKEDSIVKEG